MTDPRLSRRQFVQTGTAAAAAMALPAATVASEQPKQNHKSVRIKSVDLRFEVEPLKSPIGFKGGYLSELWQNAALLESDSGYQGIGLNTQSVLWSDASVFNSHTESGGNAMMHLMLEHALQRIRNSTFTDPVALLDSILPDTYEYGKTITQNKRLRKTFALNALVALDNAAWMVYARENGFETFDDMIPEAYKRGLGHRHQKLGRILCVFLSDPVCDMVKAVEEGYFLFQAKIGQPGTQQEMLEKDKRRIEEIHKAIGHKRIPHTKDGKIPYYFDANGRYKDKATLLRLLDHADEIGARDQIILIEEPFPGEYEVDVSDIGIRISADESAHSDRDVEAKIQMGYGAVTLKSIAKTLSMTLKIINVAHKHGIPCLCTDLTVNPILVDWQKNVAARLAPYPGLGLSFLETNGQQNYRNWEKMVGYHPCHGAPWTVSKNGFFDLDQDFYRRSGGIFIPSEHYRSLFPKK